MKNWKTTLAGAAGAVILLLVQYFSKGGVDLKTIAEASLTSGLGYLASDANIEETVKESPIASNVLAMLDKLSANLAQSQPANPLLIEAHALLKKLSDNVAALPVAVAAAVPPAPDNTGVLYTLASQVDTIHQVVTNPAPVVSVDVNAPAPAEETDAPVVGLKLPGKS